MSLGSNSGLDDTMDLGGSTGHSDLCDSSGSMTLGHKHDPRCQHRLLTSAQPLVVTRGTGIDTDPGCQYGYRPRYDPQRQLGPGKPRPWIDLQATRIEMAQTAECLSNSNMTAGGGLEPGHPCSFWWQQRFWTSKQTLAVEGLEAQTWSLVAARPGCHHDYGWW